MSPIRKPGWNVIASMRSPEVEAELGELPDVLVTRLDVQDRTSTDRAIEAGLIRERELWRRRLHAADGERLLREKRRPRGLL